MKSKFFLAGILFCMFVLLIPSMAQSKGKGGSIELKMLSETLGDAAGTPVDAFAHKENRIEFQQPGVQKYDDFFKDVAIVSGTVTETRFVVNQVNEGKITMADAQPVVTFGLTALPKMENRIPSLIDQAEAFKPADDFPGFRNKMKIPGVVSGLVDAGTALKKAATEIPDLLKELKAIGASGTP